MGMLIFMSFGLMMLLGLPTLSAFYAKHLGRSFWRWFIIGLFLPGIATIILSFLPDLSEDAPAKEAGDKTQDTKVQDQR